MFDCTEEEQENFDPVSILSCLTLETSPGLHSKRHKIFKTTGKNVADSKEEVQVLSLIERRDELTQLLLKKEDLPSGTTPDVMSYIKDLERTLYRTNQELDQMYFSYAALANKFNRSETLRAQAKLVHEERQKQFKREMLAIKQKHRQREGKLKDALQREDSFSSIREAHSPQLQRRNSTSSPKTAFVPPGILHHHSTSTPPSYSPVRANRLLSSTRKKSLSPGHGLRLGRSMTTPRDKTRKISIDLSNDLASPVAYKRPSSVKSFDADDVEGFTPRPSLTEENNKSERANHFDDSHEEGSAVERRKKNNAYNGPPIFEFTLNET